MPLTELLHRVEGKSDRGDIHGTRYAEIHATGGRPLDNGSLRFLEMMKKLGLVAASLFIALLPMLIA
ncbi:MAG TPA: hypothetical protein VFX78_06700 [Candidatus Eisenbacteria bacterium]|jgi:hypothetical protein|nr:hypothetical protein [Candidatus Eisenbacteria bacterium]